MAKYKFPGVTDETLADILGERMKKRAAIREVLDRLPALREATESQITSLGDVYRLNDFERWLTEQLQLAEAEVNALWDYQCRKEVTAGSDTSGAGVTP